MVNSKINIGVIGLGWVAKNRHIPCILRNNQVHLFGIVDQNEDRIRPFISKYPWLKSSVSDNAEINWLDEIEAVVIATDPSDHFLLAKKMLLAGKNVLIEKPMTMSINEGRELRVIAMDQKRVCCVSHNFQFASSVLKLKSLIKNGKLGQILGVEVIQWSNPRRRLPVWHEELPLGLFYDESPHMFYLMNSLVDDEISYLSSSIVYASGKKTPANVTALYSSGNIPIRLVMNFMTSLSEWQVVVFGSKYLGIVDIFRDILVVAPNDASHNARNILTTTAYVTFTHLMGSLRSGLKLINKKLLYGVDIVHDKFAKGIRENLTLDGIFVDDGIKIVAMQHDVINKSNIFRIGDENISGQ